MIGKIEISLLDCISISLIFISYVLLCFLVLYMSFDITELKYLDRLVPVYVIILRCVCAFRSELSLSAYKITGYNNGQQKLYVQTDLGLLISQRHHHSLSFRFWICGIRCVAEKYYLI